MVESIRIVILWVSVLCIWALGTWYTYKALLDEMEHHRYDEIRLPNIYYLLIAIIAWAPIQISVILVVLIGKIRGDSDGK